MEIILLVFSLYFAIAAFKRASSAHHRIKQLEKTIEKLTEQKSETDQSTHPEKVSDRKTFVGKRLGREPDFNFSTDSPANSKFSQTEIKPSKRFPNLSITPEQIKSQWMVWLGGVCVALAGIFLVKYSIDQGYLGPLGRVVVGLATGLGLHIGAEWWRERNSERYGSIAALAGGASIVLYAALIAAHLLYHLWPPVVVFICLSIVSLATMWLALLHGPIIAILGILGAYLVPILVETGRHEINGALVYSLIVSASAFWLMRYVYRYWLWLGTMIGGLSWYILSLMQNRIENWDAVYLTIFAYLMLSIREADFSLKIERPRVTEKLIFYGIDLSFLYDLRTCGLLVVIAAQCLAVTTVPVWTSVVFQWLLLMVLVLLASRNDRNMLFLPWVTMLAHAAAIILSVFYGSTSLFVESFRGSNQPLFIQFMFSVALIFTVISFSNRKKTSSVNLNVSLTWLAPVVSLAVIYICQEHIHGNLTWSLGTLLLTAIYAALAGVEIRNRRDELNTAWLFIATHAAYSIAVVILFSEATLTLALAVQIITLVWVGQRFNIAYIDYVAKGVLLLVVARLTLNPWLIAYPAETHWSLWTYGGSFMAVAISSKLCLPDTSLRSWLEGAAILLLVLFLNTELRYQLYDGHIFIRDYTFTEAAMNTNLWAALALLCQYRSRFAASTKPVYEYGAKILMCFAVINYLLLLSFYNPLLRYQAGIGSQPIFNILLVAYATPVLIWVISSYLFTDTYQTVFQALASFAAWFFVTIEIRHLWCKDGYLHLLKTMSDGELYTYSLAWLLMGGGTFSYGVLKQHKNVYLTGLALLGLVISKIFVIDMADLTGLLRVLSFMCLGLSLLGLAYLHQYLEKRRKET